MQYSVIFTIMTLLKEGRNIYIAILFLSPITALVSTKFPYVYQEFKDKMQLFIEHNVIIFICSNPNNDFFI